MRISGNPKPVLSQGQAVPNSDSQVRPGRFSELLYRRVEGQAKEPAKAPDKSVLNLLGESVREVMESEKRLDRLYRRVRRHGITDVEDVIELQVATYRYSQQVDLLSKVVDRTTSALKEVLRTRL